MNLDPHQKEFVKLLQQSSHAHRPFAVFRDFCELAALALSNAVDLLQYEKREARYLDIAKAYTAEEMKRFAAMLAQVVESLHVGGFHDCLGQLFMSLELGDHWKGQYFTPYEVARLMASVTLTDGVKAIIERQGFFTMSEPTTGAGGMVIAAAHVLHEQGINYQQCMHVTAQDIDITAVHMTYIQLALLHVPAIVIHGNSLAPGDENKSYWATPAHVLGFWDSKLQRARRAETPAAEPVAPLVDQRDEIVKTRVEQTEQLNLFA